MFRSVLKHGMDIQQKIAVSGFVVLPLQHATVNCKLEIQIKEFVNMSRQAYPASSFSVTSSGTPPNLSVDTERKRPTRCPGAKGSWQNSDCTVLL